MEQVQSIWPEKHELKVSEPVIQPPYAVLSEVSGALKGKYPGLEGVIKASYRYNNQGDRTQFSYSFFLSGEHGEVKLFEVAIQDDGWYPAIFRTYQQQVLGAEERAENDQQLLSFISNYLKTDFVKNTLKSFL